MIFPILLLDEHPWHALDVFVSHLFVFGFNLSLWVMVKFGFMFSLIIISSQVYHCTSLSNFYGCVE